MEVEIGVIAGREFWEVVAGGSVIWWESADRRGTSVTDAAGASRSIEEFGDPFSDTGGIELSKGVGRLLAATSNDSCLMIAAASDPLEDIRSASSCASDIGEMAALAGSSWNDVSNAQSGNAPTLLVVKFLP